MTRRVERLPVVEDLIRAACIEAAARQIAARDCPTSALVQAARDVGCAPTPGALLRIGSIAGLGEETRRAVLGDLYDEVRCFHVAPAPPQRGRVGRLVARLHRSLA